MKKLLLGLGALAAITAPVAAVIACSDKSGDVSTDQIEITTLATKIIPKNTSIEQTKIGNKAKEIIQNTGAKIIFEGKTFKNIDTFMKVWISALQKYIDSSVELQQAQVSKIGYKLTDDGIIVTIYDSRDNPIQSTKDAVPGSGGRLIDNNGVDIYELKSYVLGMLGVPSFNTGGPSGGGWMGEHKLIIEHPDSEMTRV